MSVSDVLAKLKSDGDTVKPFTPYQEGAIIALALDHPDFFTSVGRFFNPGMFSRLETKLVIAELLNVFEKHNVVPTRSLLRDKIESYLTVDDPYDEILAVVDQQSDPRDVPLIKDTLLQWAKDRAYGMLYDDEAIAAYGSGNYKYLDEIIEKANRIADVGQRGFWFFESYQTLFEPDAIDHRTTGFNQLDKLLNNGGPSPKEVVCWIAGTGVGKSILLCNSAISSIKGIGKDQKPGQDVLLITFELDTTKTAMRCLGAATDVPLDKFQERRSYIDRTITQMHHTYKKRFAIYEWSPDECSVDHVYALLDNLRRTENWKPDVVVIDYLDLMVSRNHNYNTDDYHRQKHVANELRGLAKNENILLFTATQVNRAGTSSNVDGHMIDLDKAAESFAKQFSLDYVVSLNQTSAQLKAVPPRITMYIAKNRNGPKHRSVECSINYNTMLVREII